MSTVTRPSGPLPPRVYWVRRLLVLALAALLVYGLLRGLSGEEQPAQASGLAGQPGRQQPAPEGEQPGSVTFDRPGRPDEVGRGKHRPGREHPRRDREKKPKKVVRLARPDGPCLPAEVLVQPLVSAGNQAGDPVEIRLLMRTAERPACTLSVSPDTLQVKVMSGEERVWTTQECPDAVYPVELVVRREEAVTYRVPWSGDRSAPRCPLRTPPVAPGSYVAAAAIVGGEPAQTAFVLEEHNRKRPADPAKRQS